MIYDDYVEYTKKYKHQYGERTVVLMEVGSFWELYSCGTFGANMKEICNLLNITLSRKNKSITEVSSSNPMMAGFPSHALAKFLPLLVDDDWTVVLVGQVTPPPNPNRDVVGIYSKGTYIPEVQVSASNNYIWCLVIDSRVNPLLKVKTTSVGIAQVDVTTGQVGVAELVGADLKLLSDDLYRLFIRSKPSELLLYKTSQQIDCECIEKVVAACNVVKDYTQVGVDDEISKVVYQEFILKKSFKTKKGMISIHEALNLERSIYSSTALTALLRYVMDHDPRLMRHLQDPTLLVDQDGSLMSLHCNCAEQLELHHLVKLINKCVTNIGKRYFNFRLYNPFANTSEIQAALDETEAFIAHFEFVREQLGSVCDIERMFRRIATGKVHPHEIVTLVSSLQFVDKIYKSIKTKTKFSFDVAEFICDVEKELALEECVKYGLDQIDATMFKQGVDTELDALIDARFSLTCKFETAIEKWNTILECPGAFKLESSDRDGLYIAVTAKRFEVCKSKKLGCEVLKSLEKWASTCTHLKLGSKELSQVNKQVRTINDNLAVRVEKKYLELLEKLSVKHAQTIKDVVHFVAYVDFYSCSSLLAKEKRYTKPSLENNTKSAIVATAMRHPIVEIADAQRCGYIPNDIQLKDQNAWLLYGLNAAGKSTLMKMVGLNIIMAQSGLFVPCETMALTPFRSIFTRITKGDDIMSGQSTFMVEINELRNILKKANRHSLVIGDELCCGTETQSATAIVYTGIQQLCQVEASFIFATHLHELVDYINNDNKIRICHLHVDYDGHTLRYDRTLREGDGPKTYGIEVCKYLGMSETFVNKALEMRQLIVNKGRMESQPKTSQYNGNLVYDEVCGVCGASCCGQSEVHHIRHQVTFDKLEQEQMNQTSNLVVLCPKCHDKVHNSQVAIGQKVMTSNGPQLQIEHSLLNVECKSDTLEDFIKNLYYNEKLSYAAVVKRIYIEKGISMSAYKVKKVVTNI